MRNGSPQRFGAVDVHYPETGGGSAALLVADDPRFAHIREERTAWLPTVEAYESGRFYLRELPALEAVLATTPLDLLIIDGYVDLDPYGSPGLGAHLHDKIRIPIIGVAKTRFRAAVHAIPVLRGGATRPLYVTAAGLAIDRAAALITEMAGPSRLPDALRDVDRLARRAAH